MSVDPAELDHARERLRAAPELPYRVPGSLEDRLLSAAQVAELLGVSSYVIREWARADRLPHLRLGHRTLRFRLSSLQAWIAEQERGS